MTARSSNRLLVCGLLLGVCCAWGVAGAADIVTRYEYTDDGQIRWEYVERDGLIVSDTWTDYDELGRAMRQREVAHPQQTANFDDNADHIAEQAWDVAGNLTLERRRFGAAYASTSYGYDAFCRPGNMTDAEGKVTAYTPDGRGNVVEAIDPAGNKAVFVYDAAGNPVTEKRYEGVSALDLQIDRVFDGRGNKVRQTERDGQTLQALTQQRWTYDAWGRIAGQARMADPASTAAASPAVDRISTYAYVGDSKRPDTVVTYAGDPVVTRTFTFEYDVLGPLETITDPNGNTIEYTYVPVGTPGEGQVWTKTVTSPGLRDPAGADISQQVFEYAYDGLARQITQTAHGNATTPDLVTQYQHTTQATADGPRAIRRVIDPKNIVTEYGSDPFDQQVKVIEDAAGLARTTISHYDQLGRIDWQEAADGDGHTERTTYASDLMDRRTGITFPDGSSYTYHYDDAGRLDSRTDPRGQVTVYTNNWRGQVLTKTVDGQLKETFTYYPAGWMVSAEVDANNKTQFSLYDAFGNARSLIQTVEGAARTIGCEYWQSGERRQPTYPTDAGVTLSYLYDGLGQATQIQRGASVLAEYTYAGRHLASRDIRTNSSTETHVRYEAGLDVHRRQVQIKNSSVVGGASTLLDQYVYTFDANSNRQTAAIAGDPRLGAATTWGYDDLNRLTGADYGAGQGGEAFGYDLLGNRLSDPPGYTDRQGRQITYAHNDVNEYTSISSGSQTPVYAGGNLTVTENGYRLAYDYENRLIEVKGPAPDDTVLASYTYDALGHRVVRVKGGQTTRYYYDDETVLAEYDGSGALRRYHVHGPTYVDEHVLTHEAGQDRYYLLTHLYSVSGLADAGGKVIERYRYDAYGQPTRLAWADFNGDGRVDLRDFLIFQTAFRGAGAAYGPGGAACDADDDGDVDLDDYRAFDIAVRDGASADASLSRFLFTGQPLDFALTDAGGRPVLVLYHYRARAYDAYHGRFCQRDPAEYIDSYNLYLAMGGNPLLKMDPTGRLVETIPEEVGFWGYLTIQALEMAGGIMGYVNSVAGAASAYSLSLSLAICSATVNGTIDPAAASAAWNEIARFLSDAANSAPQFQQGFNNYQNPWWDPDKWNLPKVLHHVLPKFLEGDPSGIRTLLDKALHQEYHGGLLKRLAEEGIKLSGKRGATWDAFFSHKEFGAKRLEKAFEILLDYTQDFDAKHGTSLFFELLEQIARQPWSGIL